MTDCDLAGPRAGWPEFDALALGGRSRGLLAFYDRYGFSRSSASWRRRCAPDVARIARPRPPEAARDRERRPGRRHRHTTRPCSRARRSTPGCAQVEAAPLVALDIETDSLDPMRRASSALARVAAARRLHPAATATPARRSSCRSSDGLAALSPGSRTRRGQGRAERQVRRPRARQPRHRRCAATPRHDARELRARGAQAAQPGSLAQRHLGRNGLTYEDVCGKGANQIPFAQVEVDPRRRVLGRGQRDDAARAPGAVAAAAGRAAAARRLPAHRDAGRAVLARVERNGVLIDTPLLARRAASSAERMVALEREAYELAGQPFNLGSPEADRRDPVHQARPAGRGANRQRRAEHRRGGAGESWPRTIRCRPSMLEHRSLAKLKGTYTDKLPLMVNPPPAACTPPTRRRWR